LDELNHRGHDLILFFPAAEHIEAAFNKGGFDGLNHRSSRIGNLPFSAAEQLH
jgi:hypothetical protein